MKLKILLPFRVFLDVDDVRRVVAETPGGSFGIWPRRLDCVAALRPGIFTYEAAQGGEVHLALDEGILVKAGPMLLVSVRNAIGGADLGALREKVEKEFQVLGEREAEMRSVVNALESGLVRRFLELRRG